MSRPTLVSLARELGVSRQTVSNVINAPHLVRPSTRQRVQEAIERSGYRPSAVAQALRRQKSSTIAMRMYPTSDGINGAVMDRFLHRVVEQAESMGHRVVLFTAADDRAEIGALRDLIDRDSIDACLLTSTTAGDPRPAELGAAGIAFGAFGRPWGEENTASHLWADVDGRAGTRAATEHLIDRGYRRVGFIGWPDGPGVGQDRLQGWADVIRERLGVDDPDEWLVRSDDGIVQGSAAATDLLRRGCDALVCTSDSFATGAFDVFRGRPDLDGVLPIIGFDDTPVARAIGLSSITQPVEAAATLLVHRLVARATGDDGATPIPSSRAVGSDGHLLTPLLQLRTLEAAPAPAPLSGRRPGAEAGSDRPLEPAGG